MREILFRGKTILENEWVIGAGVYKSEGNTWIITDDVTKTENRGTGSDAIDPETVGQCTGLTDKNGKKFFEGDICKHRSNYSGEYIISVVTYTDGEFLAMVGNNSGFILSDRLEVIGNIHDNPELLKGGRNENNEK